MPVDVNDMTPVALDKWRALWAPDAADVPRRSGRNKWSGCRAAVLSCSWRAPLGDHDCELVGEGRIPRGGHADGLRKYRGIAGSHNALQALVPPIECGNIQTGNCA